MENSRSILNIMMGHHALIEVMFNTFKDSFGKDREFILQSFDEFKWELEKHIFSEEKVVFRLCSLKEAEICEIIQGLVKEHDEMLGMLSKTEDDLNIGKQTNLSGFGDLLTSHRKTEEIKLYPEMDKELTTEQKELIIARINDITMSE